MGSNRAVAEALKTWIIDPAHSQVEFAARHMMVATVKGTFRGLQGTIHMDEEEPTRSSVEVEIDATSIDTREEKRDAHLRSADFLDVENHPTITFRSTSVEPDGDGFKVAGELTVRGITREVVLDATELGRGTDPWGNERVAFRATTKISRKDFGVTWNQALEAGGFLVGDELGIEIDAQAIPEPEPEDEGEEG